LRCCRSGSRGGYPEGPRKRPRKPLKNSWLLAQGDDIAPILGTKPASCLEENTGADAVELSAEQITRLNDFAPAGGERHNETNMSTIDR
jgi:diketogulonate reductase-like aldo/keto reductase